ncbi:MAG: hypothetical protein WAU88_08080 [Candidatus Zixiibacteriota bacterium]
MKRHILTPVCMLAVLLLGLTSYAAAETGSGRVKLGYTYIDDDGNQAVDQGRYNLYEGFGLSLNDWIYSFQNGATFAADMNNITMNNRNLLATLNKPGRYTFSVNNSQYRRTYDWDGTKYTRRATTGVDARYQIGRYFKVSGGYGVTSKHGEQFEVLSPIDDTILNSVDYRQTMYHLGTEVGDRYGTVRFDYRHYSFNDNTANNFDRNADNVNLVGTSSFPGARWLLFTGGYLYRRDKSDVDSSRVRTNQPWGSVKAYLPDNFVADYRIVYSMTKHVKPLHEYDNVLHVATVGKNWPRYGGLRAGWEYRIADDFFNKTTSNGFLASGWLKPMNQLFFSGFFSTRKKDVKEGQILNGAEDASRYNVFGKYTDTAWGSLSLKYENKIRKNDDVNSRVDYTSATAQLTLARKAYGSFTATYSYYLGKYENLSDYVGYQFSDHVITGELRSPEYHGLEAEFGGTYYRSRRSVDVEKSSLNFGLGYTFLKNHHLNVEYNVFNFDNYLVRDQYYTGNIVEISLSKDITF